ncbi:hypothetical protein [Lewinella sp. W8]|uniref:hypothetical protein n=1 Tax=Lewinella sp. W8 TaxID=2528208 RepID=UPI001067D000|nr:hypothetical protein [Lewinella sp. W8]MTB51107.1 hypothetical protein [Lewinella sp. W8]
MKWNNYAFFPALYSSFKKAGTPLEYKKNFIEYREYGSEPQMKLVITSKRVDRDVPIILKDEVSLVNDLQLYIPNYKKVEAENNINNTFDEYVGRDLTGEEQMMKSFFDRKITGDHDTSNEIAKDFNRAVGLSSNNLLTFDQIKELIISGRLENAIIDLKKLSIIKGNTQIEKMLTIMQREERELTKNILRGVISFDESNLRKNRMTEKILEIVEEINNGQRN